MTLVCYKLQYKKEDDSKRQMYCYIVMLNSENYTQVIQYNINKKYSINTSVYIDMYIQRIRQSIAR